uniref:Uncharacterized protein n=1 Tax=Lutzomyia longipalpis TaxID=7200 RepID=A0A1B0CRD5_LUTLO
MNSLLSMSAGMVRATTKTTTTAMELCEPLVMASTEQLRCSTQEITDFVSIEEKFNVTEVFLNAGFQSLSHLVSLHMYLPS